MPRSATVAAVRRTLPEAYRCTEGLAPADLRLDGAVLPVMVAEMAMSKEEVVRTAGLEPAAFGSVDRRSDPTELRAHAEARVYPIVAGWENVGARQRRVTSGGREREASDQLVVLALAGLDEAD